MRHTFQEAAGAAVCALLFAVLFGAEAFGQGPHPLPAPIPAPAQAHAVLPTPPVAKPAVAVAQAHDLAAMHANWMEKLRGAYKIALDLLSGNHTHLLSDIQADLLSKNKAKVLSEISPNLLSGNETEVLSGNKPEILSGNKPEILSGNQMPILSGNRVSILSNLKIEIHISNSGNNAPPLGGSAPVVRPSAGVPAAPGLRRSAAESRSAPAADGPEAKPRG